MRKAFIWGGQRKRGEEERKEEERRGVRKAIWKRFVRLGCTFVRGACAQSCLEKGFTVCLGGTVVRGVCAQSYFEKVCAPRMYLCARSLCANLTFGMNLIPNRGRQEERSRGGEEEKKEESKEERRTLGGIGKTKGKRRGRGEKEERRARAPGKREWVRGG